MSILEINSKSGLYPLLAAFNVYSRQLIKHKKPEDKIYKQLWNEVLANNVFVICKSPMAKTITERTLAGYTKTRMNVIHVEDLVNKLRREGTYKSYNLRDELTEKFRKDSKDMKFSAVIGNPPYQVNTDTNFAVPVYHLFFEAAKSLSPDYISLIHPARFLFNAGATPKEWNKQMLNDPHLSIPLYEANSQKIFSGVDIKGGVCVSLWDKNNPEGGLGGSFVAYKELKSLLKKIHDRSIDSTIYPQTKVSIQIDDKFPTERRIRHNWFEKFPEIFKATQGLNHDVKIIGLEKGNKRTERYASRVILVDSNLSKWKVFLPEANGNGSLGEVLSTPIIGEPFVGCSGTFIQLGSFSEKLEAQNCVKYIKSKLCRVLLGTLKITQHNPKSVWKNVPLQNFSSSSDIDWSEPIADIDKQLYKKYGLTQEEVDFIESRVKAME